MCRMLGYVGPSLAAGRLLAVPPHSLLVQSYKPREMLSGSVSADGFGAALWLDDGEAEPAVYRTSLPVWADPNFGWMTKRLRSTAMLAAVRSATPGIGYELSSVQPFSRGALAFVHNGYVTNFHRGPKRALRSTLGAPAYEALTGGSDSETVFALVLDELDRGAADLARALDAAVARIAAACRELGEAAVLSVILCDGKELVACRAAYGARPASLYFSTSAAGEGAALVCSEPLETSGEGRARYAEVQPGALLVLRPGAPPALSRLAAQDAA